MDNDQQRDAAEESANRALMAEEAEPAGFTPEPTEIDRFLAKVSAQGYSATYYRIKLKCPTCWTETYAPVTQETEEATIDSRRHPNHARPMVERRDPITPAEESNIRKWADQP